MSTAVHTEQGNWCKESMWGHIIRRRHWWRLLEGAWTLSGHVTDGMDSQLLPLPQDIYGCEVCLTGDWKLRAVRGINGSREGVGFPDLL